MGWSSWNYLGMRVSAPLLLDTADAFSSTGLRDQGYRYIIATEGWNVANRTAASDELQPAPSFTNSSVRALSNELHAKGFKFGIYGAAAFTTCGHRAGSLYRERQDARWYKEHGIDYLKYDDCGEANIQSYVKYFVMKDALAAAPGGGLDYYSYEPFQIYGAGAVPQMAWVAGVGDLWRSSNDIVASWKSILANAQLTNKWAPNARPGHYNDADELEIGNGHLTLAEQRSHFALWCLIKSPLIIGTDVRALPAASLVRVQSLNPPFPPPVAAVRRTSTHADRFTCARTHTGALRRLQLSAAPTHTNRFAHTHIHLLAGHPSERALDRGEPGRPGAAGDAPGCLRQQRQASAHRQGQASGLCDRPDAVCPGLAVGHTLLLWESGSGGAALGGLEWGQGRAAFGTDRH